MLEQIKKTASSIRGKIGDFAPEIGIILGTGLGGLADGIETVAAMDYADIEGFPVSTVEGHRGRLIFGMSGGRRVVAMQGRFHFYEGWTPQQVVFPVRVMWAMGVRTLFVSNASGGVNPDFRTGDIMVIDDHINLIPNPLVGPNIAELGPRFPDMHGCYDPGLRALADRVAAENGLELRHGVYVGGTGPTFETQAEYRYFRAIGGDAAGMSTTPEVIAARHAGMRVFGASVITNVGLSDGAGDHEDVQKQGAAAGEKMTTLFTKIIERI